MSVLAERSANEKKKIGLGNTAVSFLGYNRTCIFNYLYACSRAAI